MSNFTYTPGCTVDDLPDYGYSLRAGNSQPSDMIRALFRVAAIVTVIPSVAFVWYKIRRHRNELGPESLIFRQQRQGLQGRPFSMLKIRTMRTGPGSDAERTCPIGEKFRSKSLDELPQLLNVAGGSMALVGPRPYPIREDIQLIHHRMQEQGIPLAAFDDACENGDITDTKTLLTAVQRSINEFRKLCASNPDLRKKQSASRSRIYNLLNILKRSHSVLPGMTGLAQITMKEKFCGDVTQAISKDKIDILESRCNVNALYVKHRGLALDIKILWATVQAKSRYGARASQELARLVRPVFHAVHTQPASREQLVA